MFEIDLLPLLSDHQLEDLAFEQFEIAAFGPQNHREAVESLCVAILAEYRRRGLQTMIEGVLMARHEDRPWIPTPGHRCGPVPAPELTQYVM
jgi:hypothetical protein